MNKSRNLTDVSSKMYSHGTKRKSACRTPCRETLGHTHLNKKSHIRYKKTA